MRHLTSGLLAILCLLAAVPKASAQDVSAVPRGGILLYAGLTAPRGYLVCDGAAYKVLHHPRLARLLQRSYCEDADPNRRCGADEFRVPDLRGRVAIGAGQGVGPVSPKRIGEMAGDETHVLTLDEMPSHRHKVAERAQIDMGGDGAEFTAADAATRGDHYSDYQGGGQKHSIMQPYTVLTYIIKH